ncbi:MAG: helix-turn-helix domain-containing protein [Verrucomicrobia bacterium]|nr:helix-turn-helix domain-containing protein [Verrucomicrobiota bacterium]MCH8511244.1 helix-turn-helix domain-containing protein [Kiritimatiellia bacterium]
MQELPAQPNQSLLEGLEVLLAVARAAEPVRGRELAREMGMTPTRMQRYLGTLAHQGLLMQHPDRRYGVGPGIHALSAISLSASGLAVRAMTVLPDLSGPERVVALGVLWRNSVSYLYFNVPGRAVARSLGREADYPAMDSAIGRVLLASVSQERIARDFPGRETSILPLLEEVRKRGYARIDREGGEISLAVAVGTPPIAGLALSGHFCQSEIKGLLSRLREAAVALMDPQLENTP